jgi:hypothetical protein
MGHLPRPLYPVPGSAVVGLPSRRRALRRAFYRYKIHAAVCATTGLPARVARRVRAAPAMLRVRGIERVQLHADLTMLGRLGQALSRARVMPLAA